MGEGRGDWDWHDRGENRRKSWVVVLIKFFEEFRKLSDLLRQSRWRFQRGKIRIIQRPRGAWLQLRYLWSTKGVATLIGYFFWSRQQKEEKRRMAEEQRRKAIVLARQREDLYEYDSSIQLSDKRSTKNIFENPEDWAASIQRRYEIAQKYTQDADLMLKMMFRNSISLG